MQSRRETASFYQVKPVLDTLFTRRAKISKDRLDICAKCEYFEPKRSKCTKCGCFMDYKTMIMAAECPIGKWQKASDKQK